MPSSISDGSRVCFNFPLSPVAVFENALKIGALTEGGSSNAKSCVILIQAVTQRWSNKVPLPLIE